MAEAHFADLGQGRWQLSGELDFYTVNTVIGHPGAAMQPGQAITIDLAGLQRADSAGLALMVEWLREAEGCGLTITFANVPPQLKSIARACGLDAILPLCAKDGNENG